jgi:hypothetical protein
MLPCGVNQKPRDDARTGKVSMCDSNRISLLTNDGNSSKQAKADTVKSCANSKQHRTFRNSVMRHILAYA